MQTINWSELFTHRKSIAKRFGTIWDLPVSTRYKEVLRSLDIRPGAVLEIGAGDRDFKNKVVSWWGDCHYMSFDIDTAGNHDFSRLEDIQGNYDLVCMFEVIEHVRPELALSLLNKSFEVLRPGGLIAITTPNIFYPPAYLRDATHITPWCYDELGGIAQLAGFRAKSIHRLYKESFPKQFLRRYCFYPLFRLVGIDYAKQIILVAEKPGQAPAQ